MLTIRQEQIEVFERFAWKRFEDDCYHHARKFWPDRVTPLGESQARAHIQAAIAKARTYEFTSEMHISCYLDLSWALGADFDTDPRWPWAKRILLDEDLIPSEKIDQLCRRAEAALEMGAR